MFGSHHRKIQGVGSRGIASHESHFAAHALQAVQTEQYGGFPQAFLAMAGNGCDWFDNGRAGDIIEPHGAEGGHRAVGSDRDNIQIATVERSHLNVAVPIRVITIVTGHIDVIFVESQPGGETALKEFQAISQGTNGITWGLHQFRERVIQIAAVLIFTNFRAFNALEASLC
jgi:hypothetical protein